MYPNPANDFVKVSGLPEGTALSLYNVSGQKLMEIKGGTDERIDLSGFAEGMYLLHSTNEIIKIIKK